jgi:23S rRNA (adenine2503-C2)-methyltransferase
VQLLAETVASLASAIGPGRARAVFRALARGDDPFEHLPRGTLRRIPANRLELPSIARQARDDDGTAKLLLDLAGGGSIETVLIPSRSRTTLCVSTQVGCARGCSFCLTATMGLARNLEAQEIVAQLFIGIRAARALAMPPLTNVVFMGMGEPLDNPSAVRTALEIMTGGFGVGPGHVTVSTVAPSPKAVALLRGWPCRIAWSMHAARDDVRRRLIPTARHSPAELARAFADLAVPLFAEITLIDGVNDADADADAAADLFARHPAEVRINLLPMNPIGTGLRASGRVDAFEARLRDRGFYTKVRTPRGRTLDAACGQLVSLL